MENAQFLRMRRVAESLRIPVSMESPTACRGMGDGGFPDTVLVVASDPVRRKRLCRAVGGTYPVLSAEDASSAVRLVHNVGPSVICIDCFGLASEEQHYLVAGIRGAVHGFGVAVLVLSTRSGVDSIETQSGDRRRDACSIWSVEGADRVSEQELCSRITEACMASGRPSRDVRGYRTSQKRGRTAHVHTARFVARVGPAPALDHESSSA